MTRQLILAAALLTGTAAFAQEATPDTWMQAASTKSVAEVRAELAQARQTGTIDAWSRGYIESNNSMLTRAEVRASVEQARRSGELDAIDAEAYGITASVMPATRVAFQAR